MQFLLNISQNLGVFVNPLPLPPTPLATVIFMIISTCVTVRTTHRDCIVLPMYIVVRGVITIYGCANWWKKAKHCFLQSPIVVCTFWPLLFSHRFSLNSDLWPLAFWRQDGGWGHSGYHPTKKSGERVWDPQADWEWHLWRGLWGKAHCMIQVMRYQVKAVLCPQTTTSQVANTRGVMHINFIIYQFSRAWPVYKGYTPWMTLRS